jgi:hypothetical protein
LSILLTRFKIYDVSSAGSASVMRYENGKDYIQLGALDSASLHRLCMMTEGVPVSETSYDFEFK